jgi:hypothetical protein
MEWRRIVTLAGGTTMLAVAAGCAARKDPGAGDTASARSTAPAQVARDSAWRPLFDGRTLAGWRVYQSQQPPTGWTVRDGALTKSAPTQDIVTIDQFGDFELDWEWRIAAGGNAGVFYRGTEEYEKIYWSAVEYQLLDDAGAGADLDRRTAAGAPYALYLVPAGKVKPAGQWNQARVVARGAHVEHWLNGEKVAEYDQGSADWDARVKASKFKDWPNYGRARRGHIAIQGDHAGELALRNIRIREL